jgi:hypothetical protein
MKTVKLFTLLSMLMLACSNEIVNGEDNNDNSSSSSSSNMLKTRQIEMKDYSNSSNVISFFAIVKKDCYEIQVTELNLDGCAALETFGCRGNQLTKK